MEQEIIQKYQNGYSISKLLLDYPAYNRRKINQILINNNITIRGGRKKKTLTEKQITEIKKMIDNGAFLKEIAEYCNLDKETMRLKLQELNLKIKNANRKNRRIKSNYFSEIDTAEKAYWLGFLFTDGSVDHYKATGRIRLQLQERDKEILEQFKQDLSLDCSIIYDERPNSTCCSIEFVDEQIYNDLAIYNIVPNKTYIIEHIPYHLIPKNFLPAYALGLLDGDGSIYVNNNFTDTYINYTAYHKTEVEDFQLLIKSIVKDININNPYYTSAWHVQWRGRLQVLNILNNLYDNCPRHLKRKYEKYLLLKNSLN